MSASPPAQSDQPDLVDKPCSILSQGRLSASFSQRLGFAQTRETLEAQTARNCGIGSSISCRFLLILTPKGNHSPANRRNILKDNILNFSQLHLINRPYLSLCQQSFITNKTKIQLRLSNVRNRVKAKSPSQSTWTFWYILRDSNPRPTD